MLRAGDISGNKNTFCTLNLQTNKAFKETVGRAAGNNEGNQYFYLEKWGNVSGSIQTETARSGQALP